MTTRVHSKKNRLRRTLFSLALASPLSAALAAPGDPIGVPLLVNTTTAGDQQNVSVARAPNGNSVACWDSTDGSLSGIWAQRLDAGGAKVGGEFRVNTYTDNRQGSCDVAMDALGRFVIVWRSSGQDGSGSGVYGQRYAANGTRIGSEFRVNARTTDSQSEPSVAMNAGGQFVVVWSERTLLLDAGSADRRTIYCHAYKADGTARAGGDVTVDWAIGQKILTPAVGIADNGTFTVAWFRDGAPNTLWARRFFATSLANGAKFQVAKAPDNVTRYDLPAVAMNPVGDFVVAWEATNADGSRAGAFARRYANVGALGLPQLPVPTVPSPSNPLPALPTLTPTDPLGALGAPFRIDTAARPLGRVSLAMNADRSFVIVGDADGAGVYMRRYLGNGTAAAAARRVDATEFSPLLARVAVDGTGNPLVAWQSFNEDGARRGVFVRRYEGP